MLFGIFESPLSSPWPLLGLAGWCFLMAWGFRIGLLRMAIALGVVGLLAAIAWALRGAQSPALLYGPLVFTGVIGVMSVGVLGRRIEQRLGYSDHIVRINHAGGLLLGLLIGVIVWIAFL